MNIIIIKEINKPTQETEIIYESNGVLRRCYYIEPDSWIFGYLSSEEVDDIYTHTCEEVDDFDELIINSFEVPQGLQLNVRTYFDAEGKPFRKSFIKNDCIESLPAEHPVRKEFADVVKAFKKN